VARVLIPYYGNDPQYLAIVWELCGLVEADGQTPLLLDLTELLGGVGDSMNGRALRALRIPSPDSAFRGLMRERGVAMISPRDVDGRDAVVPPSETALEGFRETTFSALVSYARDPLPDTSKGVWRRLERKLMTGAQSTYRTVSALLAADADIETVYVLNGRFPQQRAVLEAALAAGRDIRHFEKGDRPDTYWLADHSALDRMATQANVDAVLAHLSPEESLEVGRTWRDRRAKGGAANIYTRFFSAEEPSADTATTGRSIVFFTSSQDEFAALGPEWHIQSWSDQWEAFESILDRLSGAGTRFYLRVHPNFATKSHASFLRERERIEALARNHQDLEIIWHDEKVNSYALIDAADVVVVWDSTVGLEASARDKEVWETAASYYDLYADVHQLFGPDDAPPGDRAAIDVDRALRFMAYLELREPPLSPAALAVRDSLTPEPGRRLRIVEFVTSGGAPTAGIAARSVIDAFRHRRASINVTATRQFLRAR
jgi:hypothetical protein